MVLHDHFAGYMHLCRSYSVKFFFLRQSGNIVIQYCVLGYLYSFSSYVRAFPCVFHLSLFFIPVLPSSFKSYEEIESKVPQTGWSGCLIIWQNEQIIIDCVITVVNLYMDMKTTSKNLGSSPPYVHTLHTKHWQVSFTCLDEKCLQNTYIFQLNTVIPNTPSNASL